MIPPPTMAVFSMSIGDPQCEGEKEAGGRRRVIRRWSGSPNIARQACQRGSATIPAWRAGRSAR